MREDRRRRDVDLVRSRRLIVRLTLREEEELLRLADRARLSVSEFVRLRCLAPDEGVKR